MSSKPLTTERRVQELERWRKRKASETVQLIEDINYNNDLMSEALTNQHNEIEELRSELNFLRRAWMYTFRDLRRQNIDVKDLKEIKAFDEIFLLQYPPDPWNHLKEKNRIKTLKEIAEENETPPDNQ